MRRLLLTVAAGLTLALATSASAAPTKLITVNVGDTIQIAGTKVLCNVQVSDQLLAGKTLVGCVKVSGNRPQLGSYIVALALDGTAAVAKVRAGAPLVVFTRKPAAAGAARQGIFTARVGDVFHVSGSDVSCTVTKTSFGVASSCFLYRKNKNVPKTYLAGISDSTAWVSRFDAAGKPKTVFLRKHGT